MGQSNIFNIGGFIYSTAVFAFLFSVYTRIRSGVLYIGLRRLDITGETWTRYSGYKDLEQFAKTTPNMEIKSKIEKMSAYRKASTIAFLYATLSVVVVTGVWAVVKR